MKIFLLAIIMCMASISMNAQLTKGHYSYFVKKEQPELQSAGLSGIFEEVCSPSTSGISLGRRYFCATLDVFDRNKIYLHIESLFDTGNTLSTTSGDYLVDLISMGENRYAGRNKLIELTLDVAANDEVEIVVRNRVENMQSRGIFNRSENWALNTTVIYTFKKESDEPQSSIARIKTFMGLINTLGISYGPYKVLKNRVVWEDITKWTSKEGVRTINGVDIETFNVYPHPYSRFYLILPSTSQQTFPSGYTDYAKDQSWVYYQGKAIGRVSPFDFQVIDPLYAKTSKRVYFRNTVISDADVETFESINGGYAKDKNHYYRNGQPVPMDENIEQLLKEKTAP